MRPSDRHRRSVYDNLSKIQDVLGNFSSIALRRRFQLVDSWMLWAHYRATVGIFFLIFVISTSDWYAEYPMQCVNMFDRSEVWDYFKGLCLSYSYTNATRSSGTDEENRVYAAHYRWIHWTTLFLMLLYYLPLVAARSYTVPHVQNLLTDIVNFSEHQREDTLQASLLLIEELGWNAFIYKGYVMSHIFALLTNIIGILTVDTLLQNNFLTLVVSLYPFERDSQHFSDPLSLLFPPFVTCKVGPEMMLLNYRTEVIGCHLTLMELYEKFFIALWFWFALLLIGTMLKIFSLILLKCCKCLQRRLVSVCVEKQEGDSVLAEARYSTGDLIVLSKLRGVLDTQVYRQALHHAAFIDWPDYFEEEQIPPEEPIISLIY